MSDGFGEPCECPEHLRALIETRDAFRGVEKAVRDQTRIMVKALEADRRTRALAPAVRGPAASTGPPPIVRLAAELVGDALGSPGVKKSIMEILNGGQRAARRGRRR